MIRRTTASQVDPDGAAWFHRGSCQSRRCTYSYGDGQAIRRCVVCGAAQHVDVTFEVPYVVLSFEARKAWWTLIDARPA